MAMPMDGFTLSYMRRELLAALQGGRVDKVNQPERDALVLLIRSGAGVPGKNLSQMVQKRRCGFSSAHDKPSSADLVYNCSFIK